MYLLITHEEWVANINKKYKILIFLGHSGACVCGCFLQFT